MAVRTPSGTTLPGNLTIIPSEQKWVFHSIYRLAFPHLYSSEVCSRNRLVLTDEDDALYKSFCTFHGIWMAYKKDMLPLLNACRSSKLYGELTNSLFNLNVFVRMFY